MRGHPWFESDDPDNEFEFDEAELAFADRLRELAGSWTVPWADSWVGRPDDYSSLLAAVSLSDPVRRLSLVDIGVHVTGSTLRGDRLHNQLYFLPHEPTRLATKATGSPQQLAEHAAAWFEAVLREPIVRYEWEHDGRVYADLYLFADGKEGLAQSYDDRLAPPGRLPRLTAAGFVRNGWVHTVGLGEPDRVVPIR
jgi:hypothetical protein